MLLNFIYRFYDKRDAEEALEAMDGRKLDGRELRVQMARYGRPTSPSNNNRRNNNRRGGGGGRRRSRSPMRRRSRSPRRRSYSRSRSPQSRSPVRRTKFSRSPVRRSLSRSGSRNGLPAIGSGTADRGRSVSRSRSRS